MPRKGIIDKLMRTMIVATALFASLAYGQNPDIRFSVSRDGDALQTEAHVDLPVAQALAWAVLTDYEHYADFISSMRVSKIVSRDADGIVVDQKGRFNYLFFSQEIEVRLLVSELPPVVVESRALAGDFLIMNGRYELQPLGNSVRLNYSGRLQSKFSLPPLIGTSIVRYVLLRNFREMVAEILRRNTAQSGAPSEKIK